MSAKVIRLTRYNIKGAPGEELAEAELAEGVGMKGDMHQGGERQLSLLSAEARAWMDSQAEPGLCFGKFKENILIADLNWAEIQDGACLSAGQTVLRVIGAGKRCYTECGLFSAGADCFLSGGAAFAAAERGGTIRTGDSITIIS